MDCRNRIGKNVEVAEWSKAVDSGSIPKGRGFKSRLQHFFIVPTVMIIITNNIKYLSVYQINDDVKI